MRFIKIIVILAFGLNSMEVYAKPQGFPENGFFLPKAGTMVALSPVYNPPILKGIKVHPENPFAFDFILDQGDRSVIGAQAKVLMSDTRGSSQSYKEQLKTESIRLIKYFLASLTIPEKDLWVNLSPYEKSRTIPESFGLTQMGRDLLAQDYMLKQVTASLIYPESNIGREFWKQVYAKAMQQYGTTNIPVNTFNKVWIVPQKALVYENARQGVAYVVKSQLKVMLEQDYLALAKHVVTESRPKDTSLLGSQIVRAVVLPQLNKEVNEGKNFACLRQVFNSVILATWYKNKMRDSILAQIYEDKQKVSGVDYKDSLRVETIYHRYLQAFKKGVYNYIKEEHDPLTQEIIPRKYFSGGVNFAMASEGEDKGKNTDLGTSGIIQVTDGTSIPGVKAMGIIDISAVILEPWQEGDTAKSTAFFHKEKDFVHDLDNIFTSLFLSLVRLKRRLGPEHKSLFYFSDGLEAIYHHYKEQRELLDSLSKSDPMSKRPGFRVAEQLLNVYKEQLLLTLGHLGEALVQINTQDSTIIEILGTVKQLIQKARNFISSSEKGFFLDKPFIKGIYHGLQPIIAERSLDINFIAEFNSVYIDGYQGPLESAFINILKNAILAIAGQGQGKGAIKFNVQLKGQRAIIDISNTGGAMPEDIRRKAFQERGITTRAHEGGQGRGLFSVAEKVKANGGTISIETHGTPEVGETKFVIALPIGHASVPSSPVSQAMTSQQPESGKRKILTIDKNHAMSPTNGGIDLTAGNLKVQTTGDNGQAVKFFIDPAFMVYLHEIPGFTPVIINIQPLTDLNAFLGLHKGVKN